MERTNVNGIHSQRSGVDAYCRLHHQSINQSINFIDERIKTTTDIVIKINTKIKLRKVDYKEKKIIARRNG